MTATDPRFPEPSTTGTVDFRGHQTWYRVTGDLDPDVAAGAPRRAARRPGRGAQLLPHDGQPRQRRAGGHPLRPARLRAQHPPARRRPRLLDRRAVRRGAAGRRRPPSASATGSTCSASPGAGCWGREFVLADPHGVQSLTICDSPASMPLWLEAAGTLRSRLPDGCAGDAVPPRGGRHHRLRRVPRRDAGLLRPACLPGDAQPAGGAGLLRPARGRTRPSTTR